MEDRQGHLGSEVCYDFGDMSCGDLLIVLLKAMRPLLAGTLVEVRALDPGAPIDIPAWYRMVGHALLVRAGGPQNTHYLIRYVQADAEEELLQELWRHTVAVSPVTNTLARPVTMDIALRQIF